MIKMLLRIQVAQQLTGICLPHGTKERTDVFKMINDWQLC